MKPLLQRLPELFFIGLGVYWASENYLVSETINWIALLFVIILIAQIFMQHRIGGMVLGMVAGLVCAYMMFAVLSELRKFEFINDEALQLLAFGLGIFGSGVIFATAMVYKFVTSLQNSLSGEQRLTA